MPGCFVKLFLYYEIRLPPSSRESHLSQHFSRVVANCAVLISQVPRLERENSEQQERDAPTRTKGRRQSTCAPYAPALFNLLAPWAKTRGAGPICRLDPT